MIDDDRTRTRIIELVREATGFGPVEAGGLVHRIMLALDEPSQECEHHSWAGLMALLDEHWPADVFPTRDHDDLSRDAGARIVSLLRWVDHLKHTSLRPGQLVTFEVAGATWTMIIGDRVESFRALARNDTDGFLRVHEVTAIPAEPVVCGTVNPADDQLFCHLPPRHKKEHRVGHRSWENEEDRRERCGITHPDDPWMDCQLAPDHVGQEHRRGEHHWPRACNMPHPTRSETRGHCNKILGHSGGHGNGRWVW